LGAQIVFGVFVVIAGLHYFKRTTKAIAAGDLDAIGLPRLASIGCVVIGGLLAFFSVMTLIFGEVIPR
jgi:hypothetical protein